MKNVSICIVNYNQEVFDKFIGKYIPEVEAYGFKIHTIKPTGKRQCLASMYNKLMFQTNTPYVLFVHADTKLMNLKEVLTKSIESKPDFGAMGHVGIRLTKNKGKEYRRGNIHCQYEMETLDSCSMLINKKHNLKFDSKTFNGLHLCVEDYCCQVRSKGLKVYTFYGKCLVHYSNTLRQQGSQWGDYAIYRERLNKKWKRKVKTT